MGLNKTAAVVCKTTAYISMNVKIKLIYIKLYEKST
jgi:hypothetical protein